MDRARESSDLPLIKRPLREQCYEEPEISEGGKGNSVTEGEGSRELGVNKDLAYIMHVKEIFKDQRQKYKAFLDVMKDYKYRRIQLPGVNAKVKELFKGHSDLLSMFNTYLPEDHQMNLTEDCGANPSDDDGALRTKYKQEFFFCQRVEESLSILEYQEFLWCLDAYCKEDLTRNDLKCLVSSLLQESQDLSSGFDDFLKHCENIDEFVEELKEKTESLYKRRLAYKSLKVGDKNKEQKLQNDEEDLDLSNCELVTPSYWLRPEDYVPPARRNTELGALVLNDRLVSVISVRDKHVQKNPYEETLSNCEDDMFELDILINCLSSTVKCAKKLLNSINDSTVDPGSPIRIEEHFSVYNLRCIERIYGDQGLEVVDLLGQKPLSTLPVILPRLKQKQEELMNYKASYRDVWSEAFAQNHYKSLDHRSFNFKQQDLKSFCTTALVTEIKEIKEKKQNEGDEVLILASGGRVPLISHLTYEYADTSIHEDMNEFIKYLCGLVCNSKRQTEKVMMLWENILEGMLGVLIKAHTSEGIGDVEESIQSRANSEAERYKDSDRGVSGSEIADDESPRETPEKDESNSTVEGGEKGTLEVHCSGDGTSTFSENFFQSVKPLNKQVIPAFQYGRRDSRIFYGNEKHYVLFRLHQIVYQRLLSAKKTATAAEMKEGSSSNANPSYLYRRFITTLYGLLDGSTTNANFEDDCRAMMGSDCYILFTLDGLIYELVEQLQVVARDETCDKILQLYEYESSRGNYVDAPYLDNVHFILHDDSVYRFEYLSGRSILSIQLIDDAYKNDNVVATSPDPGFVAYLNNNFLLGASHTRESRRVFLQRNKQKYSGLDEPSALSKAMEGVILDNGLKCRIVCGSHKCKYVIATEDTFIRIQRRRTSSSSGMLRNQERVERFHKLLETKL